MSVVEEYLIGFTAKPVASSEHEALEITKGIEHLNRTLNLVRLEVFVAEPII